MSLQGADRIGVLAAELMDLVEQEETERLEDGQHATVGAIALVVEINTGSLEGPGATVIRYRCSDPRRWIQRALFEEARREAFE